MLKVGKTWFSWFSAAAKGAGVEFVIAVIKQAPIEEISPWVSQNVLRRGIRTGREHLLIGFNHVLEFAQELQVKYGKVGTLWYDAAGSSGIMGLTFSSSAHVTK